MKKFYAFLLACAMTFSVNAQTHMRVFKGGDSDRMRLQEVTFDQGKMTVGGTTYETVDSIVMVPEVFVAYTDGGVTVTVPEIIKNDIRVENRGAHLNIYNSNVSTEVEFVVTGSTTKGSLNYKGDFKCMFTLKGASITNPDSAAVSIKCGKRVALKLVGTNNLVDGTDAGELSDQKGCLYCKGHLEIEGEAGNVLNITANAKHGICTKEYLQLKRSCGAINFGSVAEDAIHIGDKDDTAEKKQEEYFQMNGGSVTATIEKNQDCKGIRVAGDVLIKGGTLNITAKSNGSRGIQTDGNMTISDEYDGTSITIAAQGGKCTLSECSADPHKCMGIKVDGNLTVSGGTTTVTNTGSKSKGIKVGGLYSKTGGTVNATIE